MLTFLAHPADSHGPCGECALDDLSIGGVSGKDTFRRRGLGTIIDVLRRRKTVPNLMKQMRQIGPLECVSEGIRVAE
jgi:hypothetical protein